MQTRTFADFASYVALRRTAGALPPVLLLGAGASREAGVGTMQQLFEFVGVRTFEEFCDYIRPRSPGERYVYLSSFLQTRKPDQVTAGYRALAALLAETYFDLVLSTNMDPLLEDALADARLWRRDYIMLANGVVRPERLDVILKEPSPRVKIVKLHGDLFHRHMAWTPEEMESFAADLAPRLAPVLYGRDVFIVGYSMSDRPVRELVMQAGGPHVGIWYLHPFEVPGPLQADGRVRAVVGPECAFEKLFPLLCEALDVKAGAVRLPVRTAAPSRTDEAEARTLDDVMAATVGLVPSHRPVSAGAVCTGFILDDPRVIVTEGYSGHSFADGTARAVTPDGRVFDLRVLRRGGAHPLAPVVFDVPEGLGTPGLRLDASPLDPGLPVRVSVAAGERVGISSGRIQSPSERRLHIAPIGEVDHVVAVDCVVAPGSAGAPVMDAATLAVRGYIVAGAFDQPPSFIYPAYRWAEALRSPAPGPAQPRGPAGR